MRDDLKSAVRSLRKSPTFTAVALTVLACGIGAATALYSVADAVVLRGLPYDEHDRLMVVHEYETTRRTMFTGPTVTPQTYFDWRQQQQSFDGLAAIANTTMRLKSETGEPADARGLRVTHEFFSALRVRPQFGRVFSAEDEIEGAPRRVVLGYGFWQQRLGGARDVVGKTIELNEEPWEIIGVAPPGFSYPPGAVRSTALYVPAVFAAADRVRGNSRNYNWTIVGRLTPGVSRAQAQDDLHRISEALDQQYPQWGPGRRARVITLHDHIVGRARNWMLMLLAAVGLLLMIACANVANLMLARATTRGREIGIRAALGAGRWRTVRALLIEGVVLALAAGAIGLVLAYAGVQLLRTWLPANLPRVADIGINLRVLATSIGAAVVTGVAFGLVPALHAARADVVTVLKEGGRSATAGGVKQRLRSGLVVFEVAIAVVLLVGATLFAGSFIQLIRIDAGFDYKNVLTFSVSPGGNVTQRMTPAERDELSQRGRVLIGQMVAATARIQGVEAVSGVQEGLPLSESWSRTRITIPGQPALNGDDDSIDRQTVLPNYFQTMRIPLKRGRLLDQRDGENAAAVILLNETAARKYFPGQDPIGQRAVINNRERTIVGIVGDVRQLGPESPIRQIAYFPAAQERTLGMNLVMRTTGDPLTLVPQVKAAIWSVNPEQRLTQELVTLEGFMDRHIAQRRFNMALLVLFGVLGLIITIAGIYGVMAYVVEQRTSEIGVRVALGATPSAVLSMIIHNAALLMLAGIVLGSAAAWQLGSSIKAFLFEVQPNDIRIFTLAIVVLGAAGFIASAVPARRAARVDPLIALRQE
jgi:putative ABC transport system permease protein